MGSTRQRRLWLEWRGFLVFVAVMLLFRSAVADWNHVPSGSMLPSILIGDRIVVDKLAYDLRVPFTLMRVVRWRDPVRGDVVTFNSPEEDETLLVKRVVAVPGDLVAMQHNRLIINGVTASYRPVPEHGAPFAVPTGYDLYRESILGSERFVMLRDDSATSASSFAPTRVPEGHFLMLGDNRDNSRDSRVIGLVPRRNILGQARAVAFSLDYDNYFAPRLDRFLTGLP